MPILNLYMPKGNHDLQMWTDFFNSTCLKLNKKTANLKVNIIQKDGPVMVEIFHIPQKETDSDHLAETFMKMMGSKIDTKSIQMQVNEQTKDNWFIGEMSFRERDAKLASEAANGEDRRANGIKVISASGVDKHASKIKQGYATVILELEKKLPDGKAKEYAKAISGAFEKSGIDDSNDPQTRIIIRDGEQSNSIHIIAANDVIAQINNVNNEIQRFLAKDTNSDIRSHISLLPKWCISHAGKPITSRMSGIY